MYSIIHSLCLEWWCNWKASHESWLALEDDNKHKVYLFQAYSWETCMDTNTHFWLNKHGFRDTMSKYNEGVSGGQPCGRATYITTCRAGKPQGYQLESPLPMGLPAVEDGPSTAPPSAPPSQKRLNSWLALDLALATAAIPAWAYRWKISLPPCLQLSFSNKYMFLKSFYIYVKV